MSTLTPTHDAVLALIGRLPSDAEATAEMIPESLCIPEAEAARLLEDLEAAGCVASDPVIATAVLDRLLHHSITVNIRGESYRLREKLKAGLLKPKVAAAAEATS
jgi:DNA-binding IclR family transcriptional regulator